jgi:hypothetical protein
MRRQPRAGYQPEGQALQLRVRSAALSLIIRVSENPPAAVAVTTRSTPGNTPACDA